MSSPDASSEGPRVAGFETLARANASMLASYLRSLLGNPTSVDDLFQETMVIAWRRMPDYDASRPFDAWLRGIARNLVMEHCRKTSTRPACEDPHVLDMLDVRYTTPTPALAFSERADRILRCLADLPPPMREVIDLSYSRGMMLKQIASALSIAEETIKKRMQRARSTLADCMRKAGALP